MNLKNSKKISEKLKISSIWQKQKLSATAWFYLSSPYDINIIKINNPYPHHKLSSEFPIQYFQVLQTQSNDKLYLIAIGPTGWVAYRIQIAKNGLQISDSCKGGLVNQGRSVGAHLIDLNKNMILFVQDNGKLEYNYLPPSQTMSMNKNYSMGIKNSKLEHPYLGNELLIQEQNKIVESAYSKTTNELCVVVEDKNSQIYSINRFYLQDYSVITGADFLLNIQSKPLGLYTASGFILINLGHKIIVWTRNKTQDLEINGYCTSLQQTGKDTFLLTTIAKQCSTLYSLSITLTPKQQQTICTSTIKQQITSKISSILMHITPVSTTSGQLAVCLTDNLEIVQLNKDSQIQTILPNMRCNIVTAKLYKNTFSNYLVFSKVVGSRVEEKVIGNCTFVVATDVYQHNMLLKMSEVKYAAVLGGKAEFYLTSPIIGTIKLALAFQQEDKKNEPQTLCLSKSTSLPPFNGSQSSLSIQPSHHQLTSTQIMLPKVSYQVGKLFEGNADSVIAGCVSGSYVMLAVQRQVHVFNMEDKMKRVNICCLDSQIRDVIKINDVGVWAAVCWDGSAIVYRVQPKQSVKVLQLSGIGFDSPLNNMCFNCIINTAAHTMTILGTHMLISSNDPLHSFQPEKSTLKHIELQKKLGNSYYQIMDLSSQRSKTDKNKQKFKILSYYEGNNDGLQSVEMEGRWAILSFETKYLIKDVSQIKVEVEELIGVANLEGVVLAVLGEQVLGVLCATRIVICVLQTGSIGYKSYSLLPTQINAISPYPNLTTHLQSLTPPIQTLSLPQQCTQSSLTAPKLVMLSSCHVVVYNNKELRYCSMQKVGQKQKSKRELKIISYFSMINDAFIQFRNNLTLLQLENVEFMDMFAQKLEIVSVCPIFDHLFAVLYAKMIVVLQVGSNGALAIKQQLKFSQCKDLIQITQFLGSADGLSLFLKDISNRLVLLKHDEKSDMFNFEIQQQLEDEIVSMYRVKNWKQGIRKINITDGKQKQSYETLIVKNDGQLMIGQDLKPLYL